MEDKKDYEKIIKAKKFNEIALETVIKSIAFEYIAKKYNMRILYEPQFKSHRIVIDNKVLLKDVSIPEEEFFFIKEALKSMGVYVYGAKKEESENATKAN